MALQRAATNGVASSYTVTTVERAAHVYPFSIQVAFVGAYRLLDDGLIGCIWRRYMQRQRRLLRQLVSPFTDFLLPYNSNLAKGLRKQTTCEQQQLVPFLNREAKEKHYTFQGKAP